MATERRSPGHSSTDIGTWTTTATAFSMVLERTGSTRSALPATPPLWGAGDPGAQQVCARLLALEQDRQRGKVASGSRFRLGLHRQVMPTCGEVRRIESYGPAGRTTCGHAGVGFGNIRSGQPSRAICHEGAIDVDRYRLDPGFRKCPSGDIYLSSDCLLAGWRVDTAEWELRSDLPI